MEPELTNAECWQVVLCYAGFFVLTSILIALRNRRASRNATGPGAGVDWERREG